MYEKWVLDSGRGSPGGIGPDQFLNQGLFLGSYFLLKYRTIIQTRLF